MIENERIELTEGDLVSPTWGKINIYLTKRLAHLRNQLEQDVDERKSTRIRGQIAEVKLFLGLADDRPIVD